MHRILPFLLLTSILLAVPNPIFANTDTPDLATFTNSTVQLITIIASAASALFLVWGGYQYIVSSGKPDKLHEAKIIIRNSLLGLLLVISAFTVVSIFRGSYENATTETTAQIPELQQVEVVSPENGLSQVIIEAVMGFAQMILQSSVKPVVEGIISSWGSTPLLLTNSTIHKYWLVSLGIVDSLFVIVVALLGLQLMSAHTLGFEEIEFKQILPRIGLAFLGANVSLFLADYCVQLCNVLVKTVLDTSDGLAYAWIVDATHPASLLSGTAPIVVILFLLLFLLLAIVLWFLYISRLIMLALGAVLSPFIFLLWMLPKFSDFANIAIKSYLSTVFIIFVHVVIIQLASGFLIVPEQSGNSLVAIAVAIGLFFTLIKTPSIMMNMMLYTSGNGSMRKLGAQIINVISTRNIRGDTPPPNPVNNSHTYRKV